MPRAKYTSGVAHFIAEKIDENRLSDAFQNAHENISDAEMVKKEMDIAVLAEECGFDTVWSAEHHFDWYSMIPDNL